MTNLPKFSEFDNSQSKPNGTHDKLKNNNHVATSQMAEGQHRTMKEIKSVADTNSRMLESILGLCHTIQAQNFKIEKKIGQLDVEEMKSGNTKLPEAPRTSPRSCERADMLASVHNQLEATNNKVDTIIQNVNGVNSSSPKLVKAATNSASNCKCTEVESSLALVNSQLDSTNTKVDNFIDKKNGNKFELNLRCTSGLGLLGLFAGLFAGVVAIKTLNS